MGYLTSPLTNSMNNEQQNLLARSKDKKTRFFIDNEFIEFGYMAALGKYSRVYDVLAKHANYKTQYCWPGYKRIMRESGIKNRNQISKTIKVLEDLHLIIKIKAKGRKPNSYYLIDPKYWIRLDPGIMASIQSVLKSRPKQYQKKPSSSIKDDTLSISSDSSQEFIKDSPIEDKGKPVFVEPPDEQAQQNQMKYINNQKARLVKNMSLNKR